MKTRIALIIGALFSVSVQADVPLDFHVSGQAVFTRIKAAGETFSPNLFHIKADAQVTEGAFDGIGLQGVVGIPMSDSVKNDLSVEIKKHSAAYITLTDPDAGPNSLKFVVFVGYATTELETQLETTGAYALDTFNGTSFGISLQQRIFPKTPLYWNLDCTRFYKDSDIRMDGCGLGATYAF